MYGFLRATFWVGLATSLLSFLAFRRTPRGIRLIVMSALGMVSIVLVFASIPPERSVSFLFPICAAASAAGIVFLLRRTTRAGGAAFRSATAVVLVSICALNGAFVYAERDGQHGYPWYVGYYDAPEAAAHFSETLQPGERITGLLTEGGALLFYLDRLDRSGGSQLRPAWIPASKWAGAATTWQGSVRNVYLLEPEARVFWSGIRRKKFRAALQSAGFLPTEDVTELPTSRIVRYALASG